MQDFINIAENVDIGPTDNEKKQNFFHGSDRPISNELTSKSNKLSCEEICSKFLASV